MVCFNQLEQYPCVGFFRIKKILKNKIDKAIDIEIFGIQLCILVRKSPICLCLNLYLNLNPFRFITIKRTRNLNFQFFSSYLISLFLCLKILAFLILQFFYKKQTSRAQCAFLDRFQFKIHANTLTMLFLQHILLGRKKQAKLAKPCPEAPFLSISTTDQKRTDAVTLSI